MLEDSKTVTIKGGREVKIEDDGGDGGDDGGDDGGEDGGKDDKQDVEDIIVGSTTN